MNAAQFPLLKSPVRSSENRFIRRRGRLTECPDSPPSSLKAALSLRFLLSDKLSDFEFDLEGSGGAPEKYCIVD